jgi:dodecin
MLVVSMGGVSNIAGQAGGQAPRLSQAESPNHLHPRIRRQSCVMSDHVYKKLELVGSSPESIEAAVENALARARKTIRNMRWFEVTETRGHVVDGKVDHWQVTVKVGFTLDGA